MKAMIMDFDHPLDTANFVRKKENEFKGADSFFSMAIKNTDQKNSFSEYDQTITCIDRMQIYSLRMMACIICRILLQYYN